MRWTDHKAARFQALRQAEAAGALLGAERAELDALLDDLDADESDALRAATARMDAQAAAMIEERATLDAKAEELQRIAAEEERLLTEARAYLEGLRQRSTSPH